MTVIERTSATPVLSESEQQRCSNLVPLREDLSVSGPRNDFISLPKIECTIKKEIKIHDLISFFVGLTALSATAPEL